MASETIKRVLIALDPALRSIIIQQLNGADWAFFDFVSVDVLRDHDPTWIGCLLFDDANTKLMNAVLEWSKGSQPWALVPKILMSGVERQNDQVIRLGLEAQKDILPHLSRAQKARVLPNPSNRREEYRHRCLDSCFVLLDEIPGSKHKARFLDLSQRGARIEIQLNRELLKGSKLILEYTVGLDSIRAQVIACERTSEFSVRARLRFINLSPAVERALSRRLMAFQTNRFKPRDMG